MNKPIKLLFLVFSVSVLLSTSITHSGPDGVEFAGMGVPEEVKDALDGARDITLELNIYNQNAPSGSVFGLIFNKYILLGFVCVTGGLYWLIKSRFAVKKELGVIHEDIHAVEKRIVDTEENNKERHREVTGQLGEQQEDLAEVKAKLTFNDQKNEERYLKADIILRKHGRQCEHIDEKVGQTNSILENFKRDFEKKHDLTKEQLAEMVKKFKLLKQRVEGGVADLRDGQNGLRDGQNRQEMFLRFLVFKEMNSNSGGFPQIAGMTSTDQPSIFVVPIPHPIAGERGINGWPSDEDGGDTSFVPLEFIINQTFNPGRKQPLNQRLISRRFVSHSLLPAPNTDHSKALAIDNG